MEASFSTPPKDKAELIRRIQAARVELEDYLGKQEPEALAKPGRDGGWSVLDHLIHLAEWRWKILAVIQGHAGHVGLRVDAQTYRTASVDAVNAILYERNRGLPSADKLEEFRKAHAAVLEAVDQLEETSLQRRYDLTDPTDQRLLLDGIIGNTYEHDLEHLGWIREQLEK